MAGPWLELSLCIGVEILNQRGRPAGFPRSVSTGRGPWPGRPSTRLGLGRNKTCPSPGRPRQPLRSENKVAVRRRKLVPASSPANWTSSRLFWDRASYKLSMIAVSMATSLSGELTGPILINNCAGLHRMMVLPRVVEPDGIRTTLAAGRTNCSSRLRALQGAPRRRS